MEDWEVVVFGAGLRLDGHGRHEVDLGGRVVGLVDLDVVERLVVDDAAGGVVQRLHRL